MPMSSHPSQNCSPAAWQVPGFGMPSWFMVWVSTRPFVPCLSQGRACGVRYGRSRWGRFGVQPAPSPSCLSAHPHPIMFPQAETRAEFAERSVAKLEKTIDDLEGKMSPPDLCPSFQVALAGMCTRQGWPGLVRGDGLGRGPGRREAGCCGDWCGSTELLGSGLCPQLENKATSTPPVPARSHCPWHPTHSHSLSAACPLPCSTTWPPPADEVYAQKMKYKAISEELDNALNDITSL